MPILNIIFYSSLHRYDNSTLAHCCLLSPRHLHHPPHRHITQFEELQLLKEFEKGEMGLTSRYSSKKKEKQEMEEKIDEAEHTLQEKDTQLAKLQEQEKALEASFVEAVGENKFKDFLLKVSADGNGKAWVIHRVCLVHRYTRRR